MNEYVIRFSDGGAAKVEAPSIEAARSRGYRLYRSQIIVDVLPL